MTPPRSNSPSTSSQGSKAASENQLPELTGPLGLSIGEVGRQLRAGRLTSVELTRLCLERLEQWDHRVNSFRLLFPSAIQEAEQCDRRLRNGEDLGPLHGIPVGVKDLIDLAGFPTTGGAAVWRDRIPKADAHVVQRLRAAGAVILGKQNLHELAFGATSENEHFGDVRNPLDLRRNAGGSSSGSAAAVAAGFCFGSLGTDTGGSIRCPGAFCGVAGLKPSFGVVSLDGVIPLAPSLDHVGPLARTVEDLIYLLQAISDLPSAPNLPTNAHGLRIGVPGELWDQTEDEVARVVMNQVVRLELEGATVSEVDLGPSLSDWREIQQPLLLHESSRIHSQLLEHPDLGSRVAARLQAGVKVTDREYEEALRARPQLLTRMDQWQRDYDVLALPTTPSPAPLLPDGEIDLAEHDRQRSRFLLNTSLFNLTGQPALTIPCGHVRGLPVGLQLVGHRSQDLQLLAWGRVAERSAAIR